MFRQIFVLFLIIALAGSGCATQGHLGHGHSDGQLQTATADAGPQGKLQKTGSKAEVAVWVFAGLLIAAVVTIDLLLLPFTYHDPFPCCRGVVTICH